MVEMYKTTKRMLSLMLFLLNSVETNNPQDPILMDYMLIGPQGSSDRLEGTQWPFPSHLSRLGISICRSPDNDHAKNRKVNMVNRLFKRCMKGLLL